jgi:hypothetical protein
MSELSPLANKTETQNSASKREIKPSRRRLQQAVAVGLTSLALLGADRAANQIETNPYKPITTGVEIKTSVPTTEFSIGKTHLTFKELSREATPEGHIQPSPELQHIITQGETTMEGMGLSPLKIQDEKEFTNWIMTNMQESSIQKVAGITDLKNPSPDQLVKLAAAIVIANETYNENASANETRQVYKLPIDKLLREKISLQCEGYTAATLAVFAEIKKMYPDTLSNTYMTSQTAIEAGHMWATVFTVDGPDKAKVSFVDPSGNDPDWKERATAKGFGFVSLVEGFYEKGLIDEKIFYRLILQQYRSGKLTSEELEKAVSDDPWYVKTTDADDNVLPEYKELQEVNSS